MAVITEHPLRYQLANELHARPFPSMKAPGRAAYLALKPAERAAARDRDADRAHLIALLDRFGAQHPQPGATHYFGQIGKHFLKWESHTEFVTYTILGEGVAERPFDAATFGLFPEDWLAAAPGTRVTSALIRVEVVEGDEGIIDKVSEWFVPESLAISRVLEDELVVASDFRIDPVGHMRFAIFARPQTGARRIGRVLQRLCEIETYKAMSMLGLAKARDLSGRLGTLDRRLTDLVEGMQDDATKPAETLHALLAVSAELESVAARASFRFGATGAYETIVNQRIEILREDRFQGRQTFAEFMMRRFDPAMRTVKSTEYRLQALTDRAVRASDLLRTRVDVERSAENKALLEAMNQRAELQLRLQQTVEGLSVVAISYYALNLCIYLLTPLAKAVHLDKGWLAAGLTLPVVAAVWWMVRQIRKKLH
ncbi:DUF3422 domain-containing protein [Loktanella sp. IMCC34160]|uniref:DUF3422 family protein n=1 Tax=Loktanella sp. IMCC34160 TaxID=2510646 RepID=UPI00101D1A52|nr:DUF3422 domain-containing protein [Loktanella sp. IMCC34160]RYG91808.1 DUF3422 domain-containing protein [Loktanella sp. IMCC34160]